ncbi:hypothetical protein K9L27_03980 [Candidatus Gracilibacteria bacterium]|nr:hypothetical protein [Candidatus Gracilibacteria bacterium]
MKIGNGQCFIRADPTRHSQFYQQRYFCDEEHDGIERSGIVHKEFLLFHRKA